MIPQKRLPNTRKAGYFLGVKGDIVGGPLGTLAIPLLEFQNPMMISSSGLKRTKFMKKIVTTGARKKHPGSSLGFFLGMNSCPGI